MLSISNFQQIPRLIFIFFNYYFRNLTTLLEQFQAQRGHSPPLLVVQRSHPRLE